MESYVREWAEQEGRKPGICLFESSEQFWFHWSEDKSIDLVLLDIQMGKQDGMELAKKIREIDDNIQIVFITGIAEYMAQGYDVEAMHFLVKPVDKVRLFQCLDKAEQRKMRCNNRILLETKQGMISLALEDIWYVEAFGHQCAIYTRVDTYEVRGSIGNLEKEYGFEKEAFVQCHRSYLVNLKHVTKTEKELVFLDDGRTVPISRNSYKRVVQSFIGYYRKKSFV